MGSLSRTVEGWMGDDLYRKLGREPDIDLTWKLLRELVGQQLFSMEYVPVPHFESAIYYNQLFVFKKKRNILSCIGMAAPVYKTVGNLDYLVNRQQSTWTPQFDFSPWDVADGLNMYREYNLRVSSNGHGEDKYIELVVMGAHARTAPAPEPEALTIRRDMLQDLRGAKTLYVIHDVVFASYARLCVRIGTRHKTHIYDIDTPIAFRYKKYKVRSDGLFVRELRTSLKLTDNDAHWMKPTPQPIPHAVDAINRRFLIPGLRKVRNNLTIPSPEVPRNRSGRRSWALEAAGALREDRPQRNLSLITIPDMNEDENPVEEEWPRRNVRVRSNRRSVSMQSFA